MANGNGKGKAARRVPKARPLSVQELFALCRGNMGMAADLIQKVLDELRCGRTDINRVILRFFFDKSEDSDVRMKLAQLDDDTIARRLRKSI